MAQTQPLLDDMHRWLTSLLSTLSGKAALAGAIQYAFNRWGALNVFAVDGRVEIDNNAVERALRSVPLGRNYAESRVMSSLAPATRARRMAVRSLCCT
jgi:transposase